MKRFTIRILSLLMVIFMLSMTCNAKQSENILSNRNLSPDKAIKDGNIVMIYYFDTISGKTHTDTEIYNTRRLDDFINNINNGRKDTICIIKYANSSSKTWVNKLYELQYDGNQKTEIDYDVYSSPDAFIPLKPTNFYQVKKRDYSEGTWYGVSFSKNNKEYASLISFAKKSVVN